MYIYIYVLHICLYWHPTPPPHPTPPHPTHPMPPPHGVGGVGWGRWGVYIGIYGLVWYTFTWRFVQQCRTCAKLLFVTYTFAYVWCNPSACFGNVICLHRFCIRLYYVCRECLANLVFELYVLIRLVQQCRESSEHKNITKSWSSLGCLGGGGGRGLHYGPLVLNRALHYVWLRLRYVSITFESTLQIPGKRGPVKYGTDP